MHDPGPKRGISGLAQDRAYSYPDRLVEPLHEGGSGGGWALSIVWTYSVVWRYNPGIIHSHSRVRFPNSQNGHADRVQ